MLGGWRVTAINTMTSGAPVNLNYGPAANFSVSGVPTYRPNVIGDIYAAEPTAHRQLVQPGERRHPDRLDAAVRQRAAQRRARPGDLRARPRPAQELPLLASQSRFEFRLEVFNLFNRTNFAAPNGNRSSTAFGTITSLATTPRQIQLGVKVDF